MSSIELSEQHQFIILASDGLWDLVAPEDLPDIFYRFDWEDAVSPSKIPHTLPSENAPFDAAYRRS